MNFNEVLEKLKPSKGVKIANGMNSPVDEINSDWTYSMKINNIKDQAYKIILLTGNQPTERIAFVSDHGFFLDILGVGNTFVNGNIDKNIIIPDDPKSINLLSDINADVVATNFITEGNNPQIFLLGNAFGGNFTLDTTMNKIIIDSFRKLLLNSPLKLIETSIVSDKEEQFSEQINYGQIYQFGHTKTNKINLEDYYLPESNRKKIIINKEMYFDGNTVYAITIPSYTRTTITWKFAYQFSLQEYFKQKTQYETILKSIK